MRTHRSNFRIKVHRAPVHVSVLFGDIVHIDMSGFRWRIYCGGMELKSFSSSLQILVDGGSEIVAIVNVLAQPFKSFSFPQEPKFEDAWTPIRKYIVHARVMHESIVQLLIIELLGGRGRSQSFEDSRFPQDENGRLRGDCE